MAKAKTYNPWTEEEVDILRECWPVMHEQEVLSRLGWNRTLISVRYKAQRLGIKKRWERWRERRTGQTVEELALKLRESEVVCEMLKKKVHSLEAQLRALPVYYEALMKRASR